MNNLIDRIDAYLDGTLSPEQNTAFESQLNSDAGLREQVDIQRNLRAGIDRLGMKAVTASAFRKMTLKNKIYKWGIATVAIIAIATTTYFMMNSSSTSADEGPEITYELHDTNEDGGTEWADADRNLPTQLFTIDPAKDTVIETMGGLVFAIPAGAFIDAKDPMTLEIREALTPMDIMKAGLSTTSNGELLETGGMFYLNARNGETSLKINPEKPVYANVPANEIRPGMQLFDGERTKDEGINWVNPKPMERNLVPVDIFSLNFYPDGFLEKVAELGFDANDRRVTDSIYYSYAGRRQTGMATFSDSARVRHILIAYRGAASSGPEITRTKEQAKAKADSLQKAIKNGARMENMVEKFTDDPGSKSGNKGDYGWFTQESGFVQPFKDAGFNNNIGDVVVVETDFGFHIIQVLDKTQPTRHIEYSNNGPDGQALFKANCSSCHNATAQPSTGPGLKGVLSRIPGGDWKYNWVHNSNDMIASGDPYATELKRKYPSLQPAFPLLTNESIDAILAYADHGGKPYGSEIDPARIAAIHTVEFQNTIIATKEFEERLQLIFSSGEPAILDMYVNSLDKKLYEIDSMVMNLADYYRAAEFRKFYDRHDGGVAVSQSHMKALQEYYQKKQEAVRIASQKTYADRTAEQRKADSVYYEQLIGKHVSENEQKSQNLTSEYDINLREAYKQLGIPKYVAPPASQYYGFEVQSPGWKNVDAYVMESTTTRTTLDYTDPGSGKKALIKYEELNINITEASIYTQLMVYLVTDSLPCFVKISPINGSYKEKLNELMEYSLVVIAEKDGIWFSASTPKVTPGVVNVTLQKTEEATLRAQMNSAFSGKIGSDFAAEISYMKETHLFNVRKEKEANQVRIDEEIMQIIFGGVFSEKSDARVAGESCEEATAFYNNLLMSASAARTEAYKLADDLKTAAYEQADQIEKSYKNPLEQSAKAAAAESARKKADEANAAAKARADVMFDEQIKEAQERVVFACGSRSE